ncbi:DUF6090 family protein [Winogradskyella ursingii]|uniref:DUF6090 family protein n=1 Tax=Winogradskyella ursingii TaxID=2686079 RepID=UPI0015C97EE9|nr:DUF6090 family protein [Winogradskyella ursingii]
MIKFFRHIRQSMINQNRTKKYLLYAIGEIILVVIGILIALQINNWNSNRIDNQNEALYLKNIESDLIMQKAIIDNQLLFESDILNITDKMIKSYNEENQIKTDSLFSKRIGVLSGRMTFTKHNPTYDELISTGNLDLIKDRDLREKLVLFYQSSERLEKILSINNEFVDETFIPGMMNLSKTDYGGVFKMESFQDIFNENKELIENYLVEVDNSNLTEISQQQLAKPENELTFINQLTNRNRLALVNYLFINQLKKSLEALLQELKSINEI